ncbi:MAG TPA: hypothetical protein VM032_10335, partial [Vicinamibacterales bacterium]|nr:hypothetical protein [Vicinamibacterales bacterium]
MSEMISTQPYLRPMLDALLDRRPFGDPWIEQLWRMAVSSRQAGSAPMPSSFGTLVIEDAPSDPEARIGKVFERPIAPPAAFLRWLLQNPEHMEVSDPDTFGARSDEVRGWRRRLFSGSAAEVSAAQSEGLRQLDSRLAQRGRNKWW